ncbi:hypothetical protein [Muriicola soli]|uniref:hypothetical protein n=1 Tax=Muriicola soli TaxID=2507538 RepID=UPI0013EBE76E|nr:hypothetical protein [Muriicola soli]
MQSSKLLLLVLLSITFFLGYMALSDEFTMLYSDTLISVGFILLCITFLRLGTIRK